MSVRGVHNVGGGIWEERRLIETVLAGEAETRGGGSPSLGRESLSGGVGGSHRCLAGSAPRPGGMWGPWGRHSGEGSPRAAGQRKRGCTTAELDPPVCSPRGPCRQRSEHPPAGGEREALSEERNPLEMLSAKLSLCCRNASRPELNVAAPGPWGSLAPAQRLSFTEHSGPCPDREIRGHRGGLPWWRRG